MRRAILLVLLLSAVLMASCGLFSGEDSSSGAQTSGTKITRQSTATSKTRTDSKTKTATKTAVTSKTDADSEPADSEPDNRSKAQRVLDGMTLEEKVGQLFIVRPESVDTTLSPDQTHDATLYGDTELTGKMKKTMGDYPIGGIALFGKNIASPSQLTKLIGDFQAASGTPLFVAVDEEGGSVSRIANSSGFDVTQFPSMQEIGATGDTNKARNVGAVIGAYLKDYGFNLDFAPVSDVNTNPDNIVIGKRAFGSDPSRVAEMVSAEIGGLHDSGVMSCVKHFPGHGDTKGDTHQGFVSIAKTWDQLKKCELIPFEKAIASQTDLVMVAHITASNISADGLPASLSHTLVTEKLRGELGFNGVVITDAMEMGAISKTYSAADGAIKAIEAGVDIVLMPQDFMQAFDGVYNAVLDGTLSESRIDESVLRILNLKEKYGLLG
ncbi:MAG: glycoside hydrolase family 3 protein [Oscillospiraceae bacterium]